MEAAHGKEAEAILAAGQVDLMITDIVMPEQDGLETILSVRAVYPGLKIIAVAESDGGLPIAYGQVIWRGLGDVQAVDARDSMRCRSRSDRRSGQERGGSERQTHEPVGSARAN